MNINYSLLMLYIWNKAMDDQEHMDELYLIFEIHIFNKLCERWNIILKKVLLGLTDIEGIDL